MPSRGKASKKKLDRIRKNAPTSVTFDGSCVIDHVEAGEGEQSVPRFSIHAYSGGKLPVRQHPFPVVVELESAEFEDTDQTYVNRHHNQNRELGHVDKAGRRIDADGIHLDGVFSHENDDTRELVTASKRGKQFKASIEARGYKTKFIRRGQSAVVNGKKQLGPFFIATGAKITGVAILTRAADMDSNVQIAAQQPDEELSMNEDLKKFIEAQGFDPELVAENETQLGYFEAQFESSQNAPDDEPPVKLDAAGDIAELRAAEVERCNDISRICAEYGSPMIKQGDEEVSLEAHALRNRDMTLNEIRLEAKMWEMGKKSGGFVSPSGAQPKSEAPVLEAALAQNVLGVRDEVLEASYGEEVMDKVSHKKFQGYSLHGLMRDVIHAAGMSYEGSFKSNDFIRTSFQASQKLEASTGATSTLNLNSIFENVQNKTVLDAFRLAQACWNRFCGVTSVSDFKKHSRYRMTEDGGFTQVGTDGQINHMGLKDSKRDIQAQTWGVMITLTRNMIINDDMGALQSPLQRIGQLAALKIEEEVFKKLLGNAGSFFSAANKNLLTGANSALGVGSLDDARKLFVNRVDSNGKPTMFEPSILLHGVPNSTIANNLFTQSEMRVGTSTKTREFINNEHVRKYTPVECRYMSNTDITDQSGNAIPNQSQTAWALVADPMANGVGVMEVAFLNGQREPFVERGELDFSRLGYGARSYFDFGTAFGDEETAVWSVGA